MTYIEFYDRTAVENICACLSFQPKKVILIGNQERQLERSKKIYQQVAREHGLDVIFEHEVIPRSHMDMAKEVLQRIVDENEHCVFDLSGGEEVLNVALGMIVQRNPHRDIRLHKFDLRRNRVYDCEAHGEETPLKAPRLTVHDQIRIYNGDIIFDDVHSEKTYLWDMNPQFRQDVRDIWDICKVQTWDWNKQIHVFDAAKRSGKESEDRLTVTAPINVLDYTLRREKGEYVFLNEVIDPLMEKGLLTQCREEDGRLTVTFKDLQVKRCLTKAGQALEMHIYMEAMDLREVNDPNEPLYNDAMNGVVIDWDGRVHRDPEGEKTWDTINEIDVILMHDAMPVFISCKNGTVEQDELYKLGAVADKFGSEYAKLVLVCNELPDTDKTSYLRQRMQDMGVRCLRNVCKLTDEQLREELRQLWL